jgi:hypothetical protein
VVAVVELWNYRQWDYLPARAAHSSELDQRARALEDRVEILTRRVGDMELLVFVLLGTSGLYAILFVVTSHLTAQGFSRQAEGAVADIRDQIGTALGDLRELEERTERKLKEAAASNAAPAVAPPESRPNAEAQLAVMLERACGWNFENMDERAKLELVEHEGAAARLDLTGARELQPALANLYRSFARLYAEPDKTRAGFYLIRALKAALPDSALASELHYDLACWFAGNADFGQALGELAAAFRHPSRTLEDRLATDIDEGGRLDKLASTPPFDKAVNDLLLNVSVP